MIKKALLSLFALGVFVCAYSNEGDTTWVQSHDRAHLDQNGRWDNRVNFPDTSKSYERILMYTTIGCPTGGCSDWDYIIKLELRDFTGEMDSNEVFVPSFLADGAAIDTFDLSNDTTYTYFYNATDSVTDSTANDLVEVVNYVTIPNDSVPTDTFYVWPVNYWNYIYDNDGAIIDSAFVTGDSTIYATTSSYYHVFEVIVNYELARVITPYGATLSNSWNYRWIIDVSDFEPLLHDSTTISAHYGGWLDGFTMSMNFAFIEGTPSRPVQKIENIYNSGYSRWKYGQVGNPTVIENSLVPVNAMYESDAKSVKLRVTPSGHSFGGSENCAEFCPKNYYVKINGNQQYEQLVWRDDCGLNPVYPQAGTWIYDRANWCPGDICTVREHDLTDLAVPGFDMEIDIDMDPYVYDGNAGTDPYYLYESQLVQYGDINFQNEVSLERILAPNDELNFNRFNPTCGHPKVRIRNGGSENLRSATITYGAQGSPKMTYEWKGDLKFLQETEVELPSNSWANWAQGDSSLIFEAEVSNPNGVTDENVINNKMSSTYERVDQWTEEFYVWLNTNNAGNETSYIIETEEGDTVYYSGPLDNNEVYKDTFRLDTGCYNFRVFDSECDGLRFFANNDGNGVLRVMDSDGGFTIIQAFQSDFGCEISQAFTIGYSTGYVSSVRDKKNSETKLHVFPNPSNGIITVGVELDEHRNTEIMVYSLMGQIVHSENRGHTSNFTSEIDLFDQPAGIYFVSLKTDKEVITKRVIINR